MRHDEAVFPFYSCQHFILSSHDTESITCLKLIHLVRIGSVAYRLRYEIHHIMQLKMKISW